MKTFKVSKRHNKSVAFYIPIDSYCAGQIIEFQYVIVPFTKIESNISIIYDNKGEYKKLYIRNTKSKSNWDWAKEINLDKFSLKT